ncbi:DMT family transporter [Pseudomonas protegens]|uniref:DMT family transporter n=2 Tax=Pseudomonas TaxID=286 RepID=A0A7G7XE88_9PSED|nr:EamA-like transporter family protein [Pseudomonas sp. 3MA1]QNH78283.1 DMT family transporter [Pseudomonas protegens]QNL07479.1 DMT family transporter [Pseudomonas protegens]RBJ78234.1 DMT family transporter [Pseudomonas sp. MWU12-2534b]
MSSDVVEPALPNLAPVTESRAGWQRLMLLPLVILAGMGLSVEAGLLGPLGAQVGHLWATLSIFGVGAALLFLLLLFSGPQPGPALSQLPRWQLLGGVLGPIYVVVLTLATPHIGIAMTMIAILSGQVGKSVLIDHYGWFGSARKPVNAERWLALTLIVVALILMARG